MKRVTISDVTIERKQSRIGGEVRDVHVVYTCGTPEDCDSSGIREILEGAIERFLLKARHALNQHGPIRVCVEHCEGNQGHSAHLQGVRYLKLYIEGKGPSMVMVY